MQHSTNLSTSLIFLRLTGMQTFQIFIGFESDNIKELLLTKNLA